MTAPTPLTPKSRNRVKSMLGSLGVGEKIDLGKPHAKGYRITVGRTTSGTLARFWLGHHESEAQQRAQAVVAVWGDMASSGLTQWTADLIATAKSLGDQKVTAFRKYASTLRSDLARRENGLVAFRHQISDVVELPGLPLPLVRLVRTAGGCVSKPAYRIPSMTDIAALPANGFNRVSTFSGCGGSSLGYRMAGFRVLWASEFIEAARQTYKANAAPYTLLDSRDIRSVKGSDIVAATGLGVGDIDLFDGSPPCSSYSTAGARGWGKAKNYSGVEQRTDDLWPHYIRLVGELRPRTFVAENVSGMVRGAGKGVFIETLKALKACGYRVSSRVLDASWLGVPQQRKRLIFVGVRDDLGLEPVHPKPQPYQYTVRDALPWIDTPGQNPFPVEPETDISR